MTYVLRFEQVGEDHVDQIDSNRGLVILEEGG